MRTATLAIVAGILAAGACGCGGMRAPVMPPMGVIYTGVAAPLDIDYKESGLGEKHGKASVQQVLGLVAWGDASTEAAAKNGQITVIDHADYEFLYVVLGIYSKYTTIVYGQ